MKTNELINKIDSLISTIDGMCKKPYTKEGAKKATKLIDEYALADNGISALFEKAYLDRVIQRKIKPINLESISIGDLEGGNAIQVLSLARALLLIGVKKIQITIYSSFLFLKNNDGNSVKMEIDSFNGGGLLSIDIAEQSILLDNFNNYDIIIFDEFKGKFSSSIKTDKMLEVKYKLLIDQTNKILNNSGSNDFYIDYNTIINEELSVTLLGTKISKNSYIKASLDKYYETLELTGEDIDIEIFDTASEDILVQKVLEGVLSIFNESGKTIVKETIFKREFKKGVLEQLHTVCTEETSLIFKEDIVSELIQLSNNAPSSFTRIQKYIISSILMLHQKNISKDMKDSDAKKISEFIKEMNSVNGYFNESSLRNLNTEIIKKLFNEPETNSEIILKLIELIEYKFNQLDFFRRNISQATKNKPNLIIQVGKKVFEDFAQIGIDSIEIINENPVKKIIDRHEGFINIINLNYKQKIITDLVKTSLENDLKSVNLSIDSLVSGKDIKIAITSKRNKKGQTYYMFFEKGEPIIKAHSINIEKSILASIQKEAKAVSIENVKSWYKICYKHLGEEN